MGVWGGVGGHEEVGQAIELGKKIFIVNGDRRQMLQGSVRISKGDDG